MEYANMAKRLFAYCCDILVITSISLLVSLLFIFDNYYIASSFKSDILGAVFIPWFFHLLNPFNWWMFLLVMIVETLYFYLCTRFLKRQTIGHYIIGAKIYQKPPSNLFKRAIIKTISRFLFMAPFLLYLFNDRRQTAHDYFSNTFVVKEETFEKD